MVLAPDMEIERALAEMKKAGAEHAAVVDGGGILLGGFSCRYVLKNLLPVSVAMADGIQLDIKVSAAPGIAKRLRKVNPLKVAELMERKVAIVYPQTPIWEGVNALIMHDGPVFVVEGENNKFKGMITGASALDELQRMQESEAV
jgi:CBS domain-containing protein